MTQSAGAPDAHDELPLRPLTFAVLLAVGEQHRHGYAIMQTVNQRLRGPGLVGPGTLYRTLKEMREEGWIEYVEAPPATDARRRYYGITAAGRRLAAAEAARMESWVEAAREQRLLTS